MKFKIACVLLIAVAVQSHPAYPVYSFLPATSTSVQQWFSQGQPVPSIFTPVYPYQSGYYRGVEDNAVASSFHYNPYRKEVHISAHVKDVAADAGSVRNKRQIQLRWRNGRSVNEVNEPETSVMNYEDVAIPQVRTKRQIQLRWRNGRSLNEVMNSKNVGSVPAVTKRQIQLPYRGYTGCRQNGRSLNGPKSILTADQF